jgi:hypothetical protein
MQRETETVVVDKVLESHRRSRYKFSQRFFSNSKFQVLLVAILCGLIGGSYLLVKAASTSYSLWSNSTIPRTITSSTSSGIELGVKFKSSNSGYVTAIRFYKGAQNTGTNIGSLWTAGGSLLASVTFTNETASGWQTANLTQPVNIAANVVYVVSYFAPNGHYSYNNGYFNYRRSYSNGPLTALASNNADGPNGVYINSSTPAFPTKGMGNANFWVDLVFTTKLVAAPVAPAPPTTVTAAQNGSSIVVSWNAGISSNPIASYNVLRNGTKLASVSSTTLTYTDTNLTAGNTYAYQIETVDNTNAASANSVTASATYNVTPTTVTLSASPATLTAGQSTTLTWSTSNATSCTATGSWSGSKSTSGTASTGALSTTSTYALTCTGLGGTSSASTTVTVTASTSLYSGKLLGINAALENTYNSETTETGILQQLGVNSERGEIDFNGTTFADPSGDGTIANWIGQLTSAHIVPLPLLNQYVELSTLNIPNFVSATISWCQAYCAGGTFYTNNSAANSAYGPQLLEILNEPYGNWWGYSVTTADINAYATLLKDLRTALNNAGLSNIGITAAANENSIGTANWDTDLLADGGFNVVQGVVVHPYNDLDLTSVLSGDTSGTSTIGWGMVYYVHQLLVNAGLTNLSLDITEVGWCTNQAAEPAGYTVGADCQSPYVTEVQKDSNITTVINQLATVSWIHGLWYYNLYPYKVSSSWTSFGLYEPGTWDANGLYVSGAATPAWTAFKSAAQANGL